MSIDFWQSELDALFVSPHPDDVELFCGGTVAKLCAAGHRVGIVDLTAGELGSNGSVEGRRSESLRAAMELGVSLPRPVLGIPDGGVDPHDDGQLRALVACIRAARPQLLFIPHPVDRHPDHVAAGELGRRAHFFAGVTRFVAAGVPHRARVLVEYLAGRDVTPSFIVDVSAFIEQSARAVAAYESQFTRATDSAPTWINRGGYLRAHEARREALGAAAGIAFAEGFVLGSPPIIDDPVLQWAQGEGEVAS